MHHISSSTCTKIFSKASYWVLLSIYWAFLVSQCSLSWIKNEKSKDLNMILKWSLHLSCYLTLLKHMSWCVKTELSIYTSEKCTCHNKPTGYKSHHSTTIPCSFGISATHFWLYGKLPSYSCIFLCSFMNFLFKASPSLSVASVFAYHF